MKEIAILFAQEFGLVNGLVLGLNEELKQETVLEILISEAIKTSEIEGEYDVMNMGRRATIPKTYNIELKWIGTVLDGFYMYLNLTNFEIWNRRFKISKRYWIC